MCGGGADETPHGVRVFEGTLGRAYLGQYPVRPGYAFVIWKGRHVAEPTELTPEETAGFWSDVALVAQAVEEQYQPAKMNWLSLGNGVPHLHVHLVPRPREDARAGFPLETEAFWVETTPAIEPERLAREGAAALPRPAAALTIRELLAEGRTAEVFTYGEGTVLKLDRPEWNGLAAFECDLLSDLADAGLPVARPHGTVAVEARERRDACSTVSTGRPSPSCCPGAVRTRSRSWPTASPRSRWRAMRTPWRACPNWSPATYGLRSSRS